jgi:hypothetical protein
MQEYLKDRLWVHLRRAAMAVLASGAVAATTVHANPSSNIVLVPPADLPALAQQTGEAMFLYDRFGGRTLLYVERNPGARLATFNVTDPAHITGQGSAQLSASGPFDFISPLGNQAELVRFRQRQDAALDLPRLRDPQLKTVPGLTLQDSLFTVTGQANDAPPARDYPVIDTLTAYELGRIFDVKQVRAEFTKGDTGTTFMLTDSGPYVIRRPAVEFIHQMMVIPPN